jgi:Ca2+-binding RTX toxin-like protein
VYVLDVSATIQTDPGDATKKALVVEGGASADTIVIGPGTSNSMALTYNGYSLGTFAAPGGVAFGHILVYGYGGADTLRLTGGVTVSAFLFGGDANDTLDASGSSANNVLLGEAGNDGLTGGSCRDLLIGGRGSDVIHGGGGDDILVGGYTDYDANLPALLAILKEWGRTDATYTTRINHLNGSLSGGLNVVGTTSIRLTASTVHAVGTVGDDNAVDSLYGEGGSDWFFARTKGPKKDKVFDQVSGEVVTGLS